MRVLKRESEQAISSVLEEEIRCPYCRHVFHKSRYRAHVRVIHPSKFKKLSDISKRWESKYGMLVT